MSTHQDDDDRDDQPDSGLRPVQMPPIQSDRAPAAGGDDEFDIVETDEKGQPLGGAAPREEGNMSEGEGGNKPLIRQQDDGQGGDRRPREQKSQRNARRRESRERTYAENQRLEQENVALKARMDALEGSVKTQLEPRLLELGEGQIRQQAARIDTAIADATAAARAARVKMANAMSSADNEMLTEALEERDRAIIRETQLKNEKAQVDKVLEGGGRKPADRGNDHADDRRPEQQRREAPLPTRVQQYVQDFSRDNDWYDPANPDDVDSQTVLAIDRAVARAGFDPGTQDYWDEMQDRIKEKLPWRFQDDGGQQRQDGQRREAPQQRERQQTPRDQQRRGPPTGGPSDRGNGGGARKTVTISPQRKDAMIQAGAIDNQGRVLDKPKYQRLLKSYDEFDRTNAVR